MPGYLVGKVPTAPASSISISPTATLIANNVQSGLEELDSEKIDNAFASSTYLSQASASSTYAVKSSPILNGLISINSASVVFTSASVGSHFLPLATNTYDLGATGARWRNIYTQDLHLNNGIGNYTIIEGEEDLYIVNNKTQKCFKFNLIEVDPLEVPPKSET